MNAAAAREVEELDGAEVLEGLATVDVLDVKRADVAGAAAANCAEVNETSVVVGYTELHFFLVLVEVMVVVDEDVVVG